MLAPLTTEVSQQTWQALVDAEAFIEGKFGFASGSAATLKVEFDRIYRNPKQLHVILGHAAAHPVVERADVLMYVPDGMALFTTILGRKLGKPVAHLRKPLNAISRYDFRFAGEQDRELALSADDPVILEDVVSTLGSVAGVRKLLPLEQPVSSLAVLLRGEVNPDYRAGLEDHYLCERYVPTDKEEFAELFGSIAVSDAQSL